MADSAFQKQYRKEMISVFETESTLLRQTVTTETVIKGNSAEFLVVGSNAASAVTRGVNGRIPARINDKTQLTANLTEWHDLVQETRFNIFASQGDQRAAMQRTSVGVINRKIDDDIIAELSTATVNTGAAATASLALVLKSKTILQRSSIPWDGQIFGLISPAFEAYLEQIAAYASADYITDKPLDNSMAQGWRNGQMGFRRWSGVTWIVHPRIPGVGTIAEKCFMYHRSAMGHAMDMDRMDAAIGYDEEQDYSFVRNSGFFGSKLLQNPGVVVMNHDGSAY